MLDRQMWQGWEAIVRVARYMNTAEDELFATIARRDYFEIMDNVLKGSAQNHAISFKAMYALGVDGVVGAVQAQRRELVAAALHVGEPEIEALIKAKWEDEVRS